MRGDDEALAALEVAQRGYVGEVFFGEQVADLFGLVFTDFEGEETLQQGRRVSGDDVVDELADQVEAIGAAIEGEMRIALDLARERWDFAGGDIGEVGDDELKGLGERLGERSLVEGHAGSEFERVGVFLGESEGIGGNIDCIH